MIDTAEEQRAFGCAYAVGILDYLGISYDPDKAPGEAPQTLYRVQVGAFGVRGNADAMLAKLRESGFEGFVTTSAAKSI